MQESINAEKRIRIFHFPRKWRMVFRGGMRYQRSTLRHRVFPSSFRPQHPAEQSLVRYPTKMLWFVTWLGASLLSLLVLDVLWRCTVRFPQAGESRERKDVIAKTHPLKDVQPPAGRFLDGEVDSHKVIPTPMQPHRLSNSKSTARAVPSRDRKLDQARVPHLSRLPQDSLATTTKVNREY